MFRSLWSIDDSSNQALIVPTVKGVYLNWASVALRQISARLAQHHSVYEAVKYANENALATVPLKFQVLGGDGGRNVRFK